MGATTDTMSVDEAELWRRYAGRIRQFGVRHLRDRASADDLVQHVLMTCIDALRSGRVREPDKLASFVLGTARMLVRDWQRGERRRGALLERFGDALVPAERERDVAEAGAEKAGTRLGHCLEALAERDRLVVLATFYGDERAEAIAARLGLESGNVRVIRHRAVARLQRCMGGEA